MAIAQGRTMEMSCAMVSHSLNRAVKGNKFCSKETSDQSVWTMGLILSYMHPTQSKGLGGFVRRGSCLNEDGSHIECLDGSGTSLPRPVLPVCSVEDCHSEGLALLRILLCDVQPGLVLLQLVHQSFEHAPDLRQHVWDCYALQMEGQP